MITVNTVEDVDALNQRALKTLARSLAVSQGRFALTLVRCNYTALQQRLANGLKAICPVQLHDLHLTPYPKTLWQPIVEAAANQQQTALMVFGLEEVEQLPDLLRNLEVERAELTSRCPHPIVLWLTEESLGHLLQLAPSLYASAVTAITLRPSATELDIYWRESTDRLMGAMISLGLDRFVTNEQLGFCTRAKLRQELKSATKDLKSQNMVPLPLTATWHLLIGRDQFIQGNLGEALIHYQKSLQIWEQLQTQTTTGELFSFTHHSLQTRWVIVKLHMGLCYHQQATSAASRTHWQLARDTFLAIARVLEEQQRWDLVVQVQTLTGDSLRALGNWLELENIAHRVLAQPEISKHPLNLAQAYGFLAEIALHNSNFDQAADLARQALSLTWQHQSPERSSNANLARYLLLVAKAEARSGEFSAALERLEKAKAMTPSSTQLYLEIMQELRLLYYHTGQFWESFQLKQQQQVLRHQQGLAAFVGTAAGLERAAAIGREQDIQEILNRLKNSDQKLLILHGEGGIGKSSLLLGGVIPALAGTTLDGRHVAIAHIQTYNNWLTQLSENLTQVTGYAAVSGVATVERVEQQIHTSINHQLLTILILDQFEEFFLAASTPHQRQEFYQFLQTCLSLPHVKIVLAMRQDDFHHLLELEHHIDLNLIGGNIFDHQIRYQLRNFSIGQAQDVINHLTSKCNFYLEPALAEQLVSDIANDQAEVSPIQLQVIGAQLQAENVKTFGQYYQLSSQPHQYLLERALEEGIRDCGKENFEAVITALFLLTDGRGNRPQRTFSQLLPATRNLLQIEKPRRNTQPILLAQQHNYYAQLLLLLNILVGSGLVAFTKSEPENLYQLIHNDLVEAIRSRYGNRDLPSSSTPQKTWSPLHLKYYSQRLWRYWLKRVRPSTHRPVREAIWYKLWHHCSNLTTIVSRRANVSKMAMPFFQRLIGKKS